MCASVDCRRGTRVGNRYANVMERKVPDLQQQQQQQQQTASDQLLAVLRGKVSPAAAFASVTADCASLCWHARAAVARGKGVHGYDRRPAAGHRVRYPVPAQRCISERSFWRRSFWSDAERKVLRGVFACVRPASGPAHGDTAAGMANFRGKYTIVTWAEVEELANALATRVMEKSVPTGGENLSTHPGRGRVCYDLLLGITRGGLIPCTLLAQRFEHRNILTATVIFYDDSGERFYGLQEPRALMFPDMKLIEGKRVLIVDDVFDSGRTARAVRLRCERARAALAHVAVLHYKPENNRFGSGEAPDFYGKEVAGSEWIVYPWELLSPQAAFKDIR